MGRRKEPIWNFVTIIGNNKWRCPFCHKEFAGGAQRIKEHFLGGGSKNISLCTGPVSEEALSAAKAYDNKASAGSGSSSHHNDGISLPEAGLAPEGLVSKYNNTAFEKKDRLEKEANYLKHKAEEIEKQINWLESNKGKKRKRRVDDWLRDVGFIMKRVESVNKSVDQSDMIDRFEIEEQITQLIDEVAVLETQKPPEGSFTLDVPVCKQQPLDVTGELVGKEFQGYIDKIWKLLNDKKVKIIGLNGMGGVGKTAILYRIHNYILEQKDIFNSVFLLTVSQAYSIYALQSDIAKATSVILDEDHKLNRAIKLSGELMTMKRSVLILDDVWDGIDLNEVGIPVKEGGIKLIVASRQKKACLRTGCESNDVIKVEPLSVVEEAWKLFLMHLGIDEATLDLQVKETARLVAMECEGLPLGTKFLAITMRGVEDIHRWRHTLDRLQNSTLEEKYVEEHVFEVLKFSYDKLDETKMQKECFLYCSLYPKGYQIECMELIENFIHEGLITRKRLEKIYDEGQTILSNLLDDSLLEKCENSGMRCVKMHGLLRDIACRIGKYMARSGKGLTDVPNLPEWKIDLKKVSLMRNNIKEIPKDMSPMCPQLSTLILSHNPLKSIPHDFLVHMPALTVLDMSHTDIMYLPEAISNLKCLVSLLLEGCEKLRYIPSLEKLQTLSTLVISRTDIDGAPPGLESLINLKWFSMYGNSYMRFQPRPILSNLINLQYLAVDLNHFQWEVEDFKRMRNLEYFVGIFSARDVKFNAIVREILDKDCRPSYYKLAIEGEKMTKAPRAWQCGRHAVLNGCQKLEYVLPKHVDKLMVRGNDKWNSCLCDVLSFDSASTLRSLDILSCTNLKSLFCLSGSCSFCSNLHELQQLHLNNLESLAVLWMENQRDMIAECLDTLSGANFSNLTTLTIRLCSSIEKLLPIRILAKIQNLVKIYVEACGKMKEIFYNQESDEDSYLLNLGSNEESYLLNLGSNEENSGSPGNYSNANEPQLIPLPKLEELGLRNLTELKRVYIGIMVCHSYPKLVIENCPNLEEGEPRIQVH